MSDELQKIIIVGYGYVGKGMVELMKNHYDVKVFDPLYLPSSMTFQQKMKHRDNKITFLEEIDSKDCILGVICVPTPSLKNGRCDISFVENAVKKLKTPLILIKSTIEIGTTERLIKKYKKKIVFSPEYAGESKYFNPYFPTNMIEVPFVVLGGDKRLTAKVVDILAPILGSTKTYYQTSSRVAEIVKYMENTFFALKVTFCNEMFEICEKAGVDYWDVREAWLLDPRINKMHTAVFRRNRGYGGKCFPKDTKALVKYAEVMGHSSKLLKAMLETNKAYRLKNPDKKNQDW